MIEHIKGNLLTSDCNVIIHQSNCQNGFGSGIAGQIRKLYPNAYEAFREDNRSPEEKLGSYSFAFDKGKLIFNVYGQFYYGSDPDTVYTKYPALESGINSVLSRVDHLAKKHLIDNIKIGLPFMIGCGLGGGQWSIVKDIIECSSKKFNKDIYLYEYIP